MAAIMPCFAVRHIAATLRHYDYAAADADDAAIMLLITPMPDMSDAIARYFQMPLPLRLDDTPILRRHIFHQRHLQLIFATPMLRRC